MRHLWWIMGVLAIIALLATAGMVLGEEDRNPNEGTYIEFTELPKARIWFDIAENKWKYKGNLQEMEQSIVESQQYMYGGAGLIAWEVMRQLKQEEGEEQ